MNISALLADVKRQICRNTFPKWSASTNNYLYEL